tara:strand:+ start:886 stop:1206 length:321 start_codon:yes stop_codon:yes gene_type:complete
MENRTFIDALTACVVACNHCADACLDEDNLDMMVDCIRTDRVCAEVCDTTAKVLLTSYEDVDALVKYCQQICTACADECEKHEHQHCQECAKACRACEKECEAFLA